MTISAPRRLIAPFLFLAAGCSASGGSSGDAGRVRMDGGPQLGVDAGPEFFCLSDDDCESGFLCAAVDGVPTCIPDPDPPPPGDGTDCSPCPSPGECRESVCIQPSIDGDFCEFDDACEDGQLCIAGRCTPDPRVPTPCTDDGDCYAGLTCGPEMLCLCTYDVDCPIGLICEEGACVPGPGGEPCVADEDCMAGMVCDLGTCRDGTLCDGEGLYPNFSGEWEMRSVLRVREALPEWLDSLLATLEEPLRFIAGDASCFDFGLPDWVENEICELARPLIEEYIPAWLLPVARAIADMNDVLSEWEIDETMELEPGGLLNSYRGTHTWNSITFYYRGTPLVGTPETIRDWRFSPSPFNASAVCGTFHIERHDLNVSIAGIIGWVFDALTYTLSGGEYNRLGEALAALGGTFCGPLADFAESVVDFDVRDTVYDVCVSQIESLVNRALRDLLETRLGITPITLRGYAPITGPNSLRPGAWDGTLYGSEFGGDWSAMR